MPRVGEAAAVCRRDPRFSWRAGERRRSCSDRRPVEEEGHGKAASRDPALAAKKKAAKKAVAAPLSPSATVQVPAAMPSPHLRRLNHRRLCPCRGPPTATTGTVLMVLDQMPASMDDEDFLKFTCGDMPSQEFSHDDVASQDGGEGFVDEPTNDGEGFVDEPTPLRATNIAQNLFMGKPKKKGGKPGKSFTSHHCWRILQNDEKWKNRASNEIPNKRKSPSTSVGEGLVVDTDDEGSSSPTPLSSVNRKRPDGRKKAKDNRAKGGENLYKESLENMMAVRRELPSERREAKNKEIEERRQAEERKVAAEERRAAAEERRGGSRGEACRNRREKGVQ
ncbi:glutathione S-transferase T3-like [Hordeum vulgare]|nr:glutathione S-transferase T3-like [Hordeum vulgare]